MPRNDDLRLSVTRRNDFSEPELWNIGRRIVDEGAATSGGELCGRADLRVSDISEQKLLTEAAPLDDNPYHAHITNWPGAKSERMSIAKVLAAKAGEAVLPA